VSRNALRHGLSLPISADIEANTTANELSQLIAGDDPEPARLELARRIAEAKVDLDRIREARIAALPIVPEVDMVLTDEEIADHFRAAAACARNPNDRAAGEQLMRSRLITHNPLEEHLPIPLPGPFQDPSRLDRYERRAWARLKAAIREWEEFEEGRKSKH
jgi:hypothetical protein